jgi:hypothetical protein
MKSAWTSLPALLLALAAWGQAPSTPAVSKDRESAAPVDEVERGFFLGASVGPTVLFNLPAREGANRPSSWGQMAQVEIGHDFGDLLSVSVFLSGSAQRAGSDYLGMSTGVASGDFATLVPGASVRVRPIGFRDAEGTRRLWLYGRAGLGYSLYYPKELLPDAEVLVFAGPGLEYDTRLRHFSIGLEVLASHSFGSSTWGLLMLPQLRYAF